MRKAMAATVLALAAAAAPQAQAVGGTIFDNGGIAYVTYDSTHWSDGVPALDFDLPTPPDGQRRDVVRWSGWWVRPDGATRETRLGNPLLEIYGADGQADFAWACGAGGVCVGRESGRVLDLQGDLGAGVFVSEIEIANTAAVTTGFDVFHLLDPHVAGGAPSETADVVRPNLLRIETSTVTNLFYRGSGLPVSRCASDDVASPGNLLVQLNDAAVTSFGQGLGSTTSTAGVHCAMRWHFDLAPGEIRTVRVSFSVGTGPKQLFKGDVNLDTTADVVFEDAASAATRIWPMKRSMRAGNPIDLPATPGFRVVGVDDFNQDFSSDLLLRREASPFDLQVRKGDGTGFRPPGAMGVPNRGADWQVAATADFGNDGHGDILWRNSVTQKLEISRLEGSNQVGLASPSPDRAVDANWKVVVATDADGDGDVDLLWYNVSSGKIVFWWLDAAFQRVQGTFAEPPNAGDANWAVVGAADFGRGPFVSLPTASRTPDILWRNANSSRLVVWHMNGSGQRTSGVFTTPDSEAPGWRVVGPR